MWKQVLLLVVALVGVGVFVWLLSARVSGGVTPSTSTPRRPVTRPPSPARDHVLERLRTLQVESAERMPDDLRGVYIGLRRDDLLRIRPAAQAAQGAPEGHQLYQEVLGNGTVVAYLVATRIDRVAQVQFLSRLPQPQALVEHYRRLHDRYGDPAGFVDCPQSAASAPTRRIIWPGREVTVMEAILAYQGSISLTLAIAGNAEVAVALRRLGCRAVERGDAGEWPVASELHGERVPVPRPAR